MLHSARITCPFTASAYARAALEVDLLALFGGYTRQQAELCSIDRWGNPFREPVYLYEFAAPNSERGVQSVVDSAARFALVARLDYVEVRLPDGRSETVLPMRVVHAVAAE